MLDDPAADREPETASLGFAGHHVTADLTKLVEHRIGIRMQLLPVFDRAIEQAPVMDVRESLDFSGVRPQREGDEHAKLGGLTGGAGAGGDRAVG